MVAEAFEPPPPPDQQQQQQEPLLGTGAAEQQGNSPEPTHSSALSPADGLWTCIKSMLSGPLVVGDALVAAAKPRPPPLIPAPQLVLQQQPHQEQQQQQQQQEGDFSLQARGFFCWPHTSSAPSSRLEDADGNSCSQAYVTSNDSSSPSSSSSSLKSNVPVSNASPEMVNINAAGSSQPSSKKKHRCTRGVPATPTGTTTTTSSSSSSGGGGGGAAFSARDALGHPATRLQLLAAAAAAGWCHLGRPGPDHNAEGLLFGQKSGHDGVAQLLLLLVQQLHLVTPPLRSSFLHSPAGNTVLQVLSEMSSDQAVQQGRVGLLELQRTNKDPKGTWASYTTTAHTLLVQQLLLPSLLLQPTPQAQALWRTCTCSTDADSSSCGSTESPVTTTTNTGSSSSSCGCSSCSVRVAQGATSSTVPPVTSEPAHYSVYLGRGGRAFWTVMLHCHCCQQDLVAASACIDQSDMCLTCVLHEGATCPPPLLLLLPQAWQRP
jgi:hypothetical protein